LSALFLALRE